MTAVMYQPYAMSYSSSCDRTTADNLKKSFKFPHAPSPPESSHSNASSAYSSPGSTGGGGSGLLGLSLLPPHLHSPSASSLSSLSNNGASSISGQRRPLTPSCASGGGGSSAPATITSATSQQQTSHHHHSSSSSHSHSSHHPHHSSSHHHHPHHSSSSSSSAHHHQLHHHHHHRSSSSSAAVASSIYPLSHSASINLSSSALAAAAATPAATGTSSRDLSQHGPSSSSSSSSGSTSSHHPTGQSSIPSATVTSAGGDPSDDESPGERRATSSEVGGNGNSGGTVEENDGSTSRAQYLSANCIVYMNYDGNAGRVVEEHFNRALSGNNYSEKNSSKSLPMSTRNFPASFWNSNYQPSKTSAAAAALAPYGAADFYGTAMDYSASISGFAHHHPQADPWHYPLSTHHHHHHQSYHRPTDITYPSMSSTSRFNAAAQYGSFLFPSTSAAAAARFSGIPTPAQCAVKGAADVTAHHWAAAATAGGRYDGWSDLHLAADYSAAAAAHYSNMTAAAGKGLDFETHYLQSS